MAAGSAPGTATRSLKERELNIEPPSHLSIPPELFHKFQRLIYAETGIWLGGSKTALLCGRLYRRLRELQIPSLKAYYERVSIPAEEEERARMIDAITTNETRFFREPKQFEFLVRSVLPLWRQEADSGKRRKEIRIWSAGCSSGEEPYTIAMLLEENLRAQDAWDFRILATDISNRVLEKARKGIYAVSRSNELPSELLLSYMLRGTGEREGEMKVKIEVQGRVDFGRLNLNDESSSPGGPFDAIFCRNVLIYFDQQSKQRVVNKLVRHLAPNGFLFVGHAEILANMTDELRNLESNIYVKKSG